MEALFLPADDGQRLLICHRAQGVTRGGVLYVPPFAEEMNKARRMANVQARVLAQAGWTVAIPDLAGCGDSSGELVDATWQDWLDDVQRSAAWLRRQADGPLWLWGLRMGCLLAVDASRHDATLRRLLLWQPPVTGKPLLRQFLRLRMAEALERGAHRGMLERLLAQLAEGETVEVAGYEISPSLAAAIEAATLDPPVGPGLLLWREVAREAADALAPAGQSNREHWARAGWRLDAGVRQGPAFWQSTEIECAPALLEPSLPDRLP